MFSLLDTVNVFTVAVVKDIECQCLPRVNDKPCTTAWGETFGSGGETLCLPQEAKGGFYRCGPLCLLYYHPSCVYSWCTRLEKRRSHLLSSWPGLVCNWGGDWERQMPFGGLDYSLLRPRGFMNSLLCQLGASWLSGQSLCSPTDVLMGSLLVTLCSRNKDVSNYWILEANYALPLHLQMSVMQQITETQSMESPFWYCKWLQSLHTFLYIFEPSVINIYHIFSTMHFP